MTRHAPKNLPASVHQRLLNKARESGRPFNELLQYYAMERFLYRISRSPHAGRFVLKGALMLTAWRASLTRPTKDIDLLGHIDNSPEIIAGIVRELCLQEVEPDGLIFASPSVEAERITEDATYEGVRIRFRGQLGTAKIPMQVDVGFGDVVLPSPNMLDYPTMLDMPAPSLQGYTRESSIAEKLQAMVKLGILNSRMKDFYDIWVLSRQFDFDGATLSAAIIGTFANRNTDVPPEVVAFSETFARDETKQVQWVAFVRRSRLLNIPREFASVVDVLRKFLGPVIESLSNREPFAQTWTAPGPWR